MKSWKSNLAAILIAETLAIAAFSTSMPIIPLYLQDIGLTDPDKLKFWTGIIQSLSSLMIAIFAPIWGSLSDSYGRRIMLLRAMVGGVILVFLMPFTTAPWQMLILRTLQGCITGTVSAATVLIAGITPAASIGFALGLMQTGVSIGNSIGPMIGGLVSDYWGRRAAFWVTSGILVLAAAIVLRGVEDDFKPLPKEQREPIRFLPDFSQITASPALLSLMAVTFVLQVASSSIAPILPLFIQELDASALVGSHTGMVMGAGAAASAIAAAVVGKFSGKWGYGRTLLFCLAGGAIFTVPQAFVANSYQLTALRVVMMLFLGGAMPSANALIAGLADRKKQGGVYGLTSSISSGGAALGPVLGSTVAALLDFRAVFFVTSALMGSVAALSTINARRRAAAAAAK